MFWSLADSWVVSRLSQYPFDYFGSLIHHKIDVLNSFIQQVIDQSSFRHLANNNPSIVNIKILLNSC
jgi:hypothetical protein